MRRIILLLFLAMPLAEIAVFILAGRALGLFPTLGLVIASMVAGVILLRRQGTGVIRRLRDTATLGADPGRDLVHGALIAVAAVLLIVPGFLSDVAGILLFIPAVRDGIWRRMNIRAFSSASTRGFRTTAGFGSRRADRPPTRVIDLDREDFSHAGTKDGEPGGDNKG